VAAVGALHSNGFVHEHIEPANVLAVGEEIKLRSDCIRETPEGDEGSELKRWDVYDLSVVLLQSLTQHKTLEEAEHDLPLQEPFDEIVRKGMSGEWGLKEIAAALNLGVNVPPVVRPAAVPKVEVERPVASLPEAQPVAARSVPVVVDEVDDEPRGIEVRRLVIGVGAMLLLFVIWFFVHSRSAKSNEAVQQTVAPPAVAQGSDASGTPSTTSPTTAAPAAVPDTAPAAAAPASVPAPSEAMTAGDARGQWRVIAFTYNREAQAQQKVASVAAKHPELKPEVFTPNGHAPYLVAVGGTMSRDEAFALVKKAKAQGALPHDSYAQNYRR
jgi:hypothetical protein